MRDWQNITPKSNDDWIKISFEDQPLAEKWSISDRSSRRAKSERPPSPSANPGPPRPDCTALSASESRTRERSKWLQLVWVGWSVNPSRCPRSSSSSGGKSCSGKGREWAVMRPMTSVAAELARPSVERRPGPATPASHRVASWREREASRVQRFPVTWVVSCTIDLEVCMAWR